MMIHLSSLSLYTPRCIHKVSVSTQIYRRIYSICNFKDVYFDDQKLDRPLSGLELLKDFISGGERVRTENNGEQRVITRYMGSRNYIKPVSDLNHDSDIARALSKDYFIGDLGKLTSFGTDPIPEIKLFGRPGVTFSMPGNGSYPVAKYSKEAGKIEQILDPVKKKQIISELIK